MAWRLISKQVSPEATRAPSKETGTPTAWRALRPVFSRISFDDQERGGSLRLRATHRCCETDFGDVGLTQQIEDVDDVLVIDVSVALHDHRDVGVVGGHW